MPNATFQKFNTVSLDILLAKHKFDTDDIKLYLTNVAPNAATHATKANLAEISAVNGYAAGGVVVPIDSVTQTGGVADVSTDESTLTITASGGSIGPFRHAICYNDTSATKPLISFYDYGSSITLQDGESIDIPLPASLFTGGF